jgi:hypothetical protein
VLSAIDDRKAPFGDDALDPKAPRLDRADDAEDVF